MGISSAANSKGFEEKQYLDSVKESNNNHLKNSLVKQIFDKRKQMEKDKIKENNFKETGLNFTSRTFKGHDTCYDCNKYMPRQFLESRPNILLIGKSK